MKKVWSKLKSIFLKDFPSTFTRIGVFGVIVLPLVYSALYLWAFWDPYKKVDHS